MVDKDTGIWNDICVSNATNQPANHHRNDDTWPLRGLGLGLYFCRASKVEVAKVTETVIVASVQERVKIKRLECAGVIGEVEAEIKTIWLVSC